jgi:hypothetical protein
MFVTQKMRMWLPGERRDRVHDCLVNPHRDPLAPHLWEAIMEPPRISW